LSGDISLLHVWTPDTKETSKLIQQSLKSITKDSSHHPNYAYRYFVLLCLCYLLSWVLQHYWIWDSRYILTCMTASLFFYIITMVGQLHTYRIILAFCSIHNKLPSLATCSTTKVGNQSIEMIMRKQKRPKHNNTQLSRWYGWLQHP
jgi:hypothetical protein